MKNKKRLNKLTHINLTKEGKLQDTETTCYVTGDYFMIDIAWLVF